MLKRRPTNWVLAFVAVVVFAAIGSSTPLTARRMSVCDDSHGQFTAVLCPNDHLVRSSYLANGNYRLVFHDDGSANVWDVTDQENWVHVRHLWSGYEQPGYVRYGGNPGYPEMSFVRYNWFDMAVGGDSSEAVPTGEHYLKLDSDGHVRVYEWTGSVLIVHLCLGEGCWQ